MSGAMRRIGEYLGLVEDSGRYDEYDAGYADDTVGYDPEPTQQAAVVPARTKRTPKSSAPGHGAPGASREHQPAPVADLSERRRPQVVAQPQVAEPSRIVTLTPTTYNEARAVGENYRDGTPVIMNLSEMSDADAKRLVDFAAGLIFATRGQIERITNKVFLLSPQNVSVTAEDKQRIAEGGFFNQS